MSEKRCAFCGHVFAEDETPIWVDGVLLCGDCAEEHLCECPLCGRSTLRENLLAVEPGRSGDPDRVCAECADTNYRLCQECGHLVPLYMALSDTFGNTVCLPCYREHNYRTCDDCGRITRDGEYCDWRDAWLCSNCVDAERRKIFHGYSYKPKAIFFPEITHRTDRYFGVELEVDEGDSRKELCLALSSLGSPIYMKRDGSLGETGVEIVTHPCSLDFHTSTKLWDRITEVCKSYGYKSEGTTTCGLHVHVNRTSFGASDSDRMFTAARLPIIVHQIWNDLVIFSRRRLGRLERWARQPDWEIIAEARSRLELGESDCLMRVWDSCPDRYCAVNLEPNDTVEFRLFRGTLNPEVIKAAIQLVNNLVECAVHYSSAECFSLTFSDVVNINPTPALVTYCQSHNLLSIPT